MDLTQVPLETLSEEIRRRKHIGVIVCHAEGLLTVLSLSSLRTCTADCKKLIEQIKKEGGISASCRNCGGRLHTYSEDNGQYVSCLACPEGRAEHERVTAAQKGTGP